MTRLPPWNEWLLAQRRTRELSQERFAALVGVSKRNIERWEKGMSPRPASRSLVEQALSETGPVVSADDAIDEIRAILDYIAEVIGIAPAQMAAAATGEGAVVKRPILARLESVSRAVTRVGNQVKELQGTEAQTPSVPSPRRVARTDRS